MKRVLFLIASLCCLCSTANAQHLDQPIKYQGEVNVGYGLATRKAGELVSYMLGSLTKNYILIETVHGVRLSPHFFTGIGAKMCADVKFRAAQLPIFADFKYYPLNRAFAPYVAIDFGYSLRLYNDGIRWGYMPTFCGFHGAAGVGFNYKHLNFGLGCQIQQMRYDNYENYNSELCPSFFLKVGAKF